MAVVLQASLGAAPSPSNDDANVQHLKQRIKELEEEIEELNHKYNEELKKERVRKRFCLFLPLPACTSSFFHPCSFFPSYFSSSHLLYLHPSFHLLRSFFPSFFCLSAPFASFLLCYHSRSSFIHSASPISLPRLFLPFVPPSPFSLSLHHCSPLLSFPSFLLFFLSTSFVLSSFVLQEAQQRDIEQTRNDMMTVIQAIRSQKYRLDSDVEENTSREAKELREQMDRMRTDFEAKIAKLQEEHRKALQNVKKTRGLPVVAVEGEEPEVRRCGTARLQALSSLGSPVYLLHNNEHL